eukprot:1935514-Prymnesium_polylepis.1
MQQLRVAGPFGSGSEAEAEEAALGRQAMREASAHLNTPAADARRYDSLTPLEPATVRAARPAARRSSERGLPSRTLEPSLRCDRTHRTRPNTAQPTLI